MGVVISPGPITLARDDRQPRIRAQCMNLTTHALENCPIAEIAVGITAEDKDIGSRFFVHLLFIVDRR